MQKKYLFSFVLTMTMATNVSAAGYQLQEYSLTNLGRAFAGSGVMADDYSAIAFNPAGMSLVEKSGFQLGAIATDVRGKAKGTSTLPGGYEKSGNSSTRIFRLMPNLFGQTKLNDKTNLGIGFYVPFGLASDYKNNWFGTEQGQYSAITVVNLTPALSYKILDSLSVGAGINFQYALAHLTSGIPGGGKTDMRNADDIGVGYTIGLTYRPTKTTRLGVSYRSKINHKLQGKNKGNSAGIPMFSFLDGEHNIHAKITTPETVLFSVAQELNPKWTLSGIARWTRWTRFKKLDIYQENKPTPGPLTSVNENWRNTWLLGLGADYKYCKNLTFRFGSSWDNTAIRSVKNRTARIPDERRIWASVGASYTKDNWQLDIGYSHLFIHNAKAEGNVIAGGDFNAKYHLKSEIFGMGFQYKF